MDHDAKKMRGKKPFVFSNLKTGKGVDEIVAFIKHQTHAGLVRAARASLLHQAHGFQLLA